MQRDTEPISEKEIAATITRLIKRLSKVDLFHQSVFAATELDASDLLSKYCAFISDMLRKSPGK